MLISTKRKDNDRSNLDDEVQDNKSSKKTEGILFGKFVNPLSRLRQLASKSQNVLLTLTSIYPLDLFPDTITIDENKINIIKKDLFRAENIHSILIEDITNVTVSTGLFTATLEIVDSMNVRFPITYTIRHLKIKKALLARRLIQGLIACKREGVDLSSFDNKEILESLEDLGYAKGENTKN